MTEREKLLEVAALLNELKIVFEDGYSGFLITARDEEGWYLTFVGSRAIWEVHKNENCWCGGNDDE